MVKYAEIPAHIYRWGLENENPDIQLQGIWLVGQTGASKYLSNVYELWMTVTLGLGNGGVVNRNAITAVIRLKM